MQQLTATQQNTLNHLIAWQDRVDADMELSSNSTEIDELMEERVQACKALEQFWDNPNSIKY